MKPKIKRMNWFVKLITFNWPTAITLAPFGIYIKKGVAPSPRLIRHEKIHWEQQMELGIIFFYLWYLIEWMVKGALPPYDKGENGYKEISFEREAYGFDEVKGYLNIRSKYAWLRYVGQE